MVYVYNSAGAVVTIATSDAAGVYTATGLPAGTYYLGTHNDLGFVDEHYNNLPCYGGSCPSITTASAVTVTAGVATTGIDIALAPGGGLSGTVTDAGSGAPLAGISVFAYSASNIQLAGDTTDASGHYSISPLPAGAYYVKTFNSGGYVDEVYNNLACPLGVCPNPSTGTAVTVTAGSTTGGINIGLTAGATISGFVTNEHTGAAIGNGFVYFYNSSGAFVGSAPITSGTFSRTAFLAGTYYLRTSTSDNYIDEVYHDLQCVAGTCPSVTTGTGVTVASGGTVGGITFALASAAAISGTVQAVISGAPLSGVQVYLYNSSGSQVAVATTDASGAYSKSSLLPGTYYVRTRNTSGYIDEVFNNITCEGGACPVTSGTGIVLVGGTPVGGIDFSLSIGGTIVGTVTAAATGLPLSGISVRAYNTTNTFVASATTNAAGQYTLTGLASGTHHVATVNSLGYVDELFDGVACPGGQCPLYSTGAAVPVTAGLQTGPIDFALAIGGTITGTVTASGPSTILVGVSVYLFDSDGDYVARATTNAQGVYAKAGLPAGTYYVATNNTQGYIDELYNNVSCPGTFYCTVTSGTGVSVAASTVTSGIDFALVQGGTIAGTLMSGASPASYVSIRVYDTNGAIIGFDQSDASGAYTTAGLPGGTYYVRTVAGPAFGYIDEVYLDLPCVGGACPAITSGLGVAVVVGSTTSVNFDLSAAGTIAGTVTNALTAAPLVDVDLSVYDAGGALIAGATSNASGGYTVPALPSGTYYVRTSNAPGYLDELYNNMPCPGGICTVTTGTGIVVTAGATAGGIDFGLMAYGPGGGAIRTDFTGDLKSDIVWHHAGRGEVWLWTMDGATSTGQLHVRTLGEPGWEIRGQGDQNGDGKADILWRNSSTGMLYLWTMNGSTVEAETYVATVEPAYDIVGTGDYNGDGKSDILWRHLANGEVWVWLMNGVTPLSQTYIDTVDPAYVVQGSGDLNGDGKADLVWRHATGGDVWVWLMNGATPTVAYVDTVAELGLSHRGRGGPHGGRAGGHSVAPRDARGSVAVADERDDACEPDVCGCRAGHGVSDRGERRLQRGRQGGHPLASRDAG